MTLLSASRRAFIASSAAFAGALALPRLALAQTGTIALSTADLALVDKATKHLQSIDEVEGRFEQTNPRGVVQNGDIFLKRPGKARFQYDPPSGLVVVSDGRNVSVWDSRLRTFDRTPLGATPLAILLARQVRLDEDVEVFRVGRYDDGFYLSARSAHGQTRTEGYITVVFGDNPMSLRGWTLVDGQGQATKVKLTGLAKTPIRPELFVLDDPRPPEERNPRTRPKPAAAPQPEPKP
ncbi:MAG: outer membrane lipoprotein carrier protein LolA [Caulobacteraceae bacterium]